MRAIADLRTDETEWNPDSERILSARAKPFRQNFVSVEQIQDRAISALWNATLLCAQRLIILPSCLISWKPLCTKGSESKSAPPPPFHAAFPAPRFFHLFTSFFFSSALCASISSSLLSSIIIFSSYYLLQFLHNALIALSWICSTLTKFCLMGFALVDKIRSLSGFHSVSFVRKSAIVLTT